MESGKRSLFTTDACLAPSGALVFGRPAEIILPETGVPACADSDGLRFRMNGSRRFVSSSLEMRSPKREAPRNRHLVGTTNLLDLVIPKRR